MTVDYRKILIAYIDHISACEGIDFLPVSLDDLTVAENIALNEAAIDVGSITSDHRAELLKYIDGHKSES